MKKRKDFGLLLLDKVANVPIKRLARKLGIPEQLAGWIRLTLLKADKSELPIREKVQYGIYPFHSKNKSVKSA